MEISKISQQIVKLASPFYIYVNCSAAILNLKNYHAKLLIITLWPSNKNVKP